MDPNPMCNALYSIKMLRLNVTDLLATIGSGVRDDHGEIEKDNRVVLELQETLGSIYKFCKELDQAVNGLSPLAPMPLYNSSFLAQESSSDRQALYSPLVLSHKWTDKVHKYSSLAYSILNQTVMKKTQFSTINKQRRRPSIGTHIVSPQQMDAFLSSVDHLFPDMNISISRPFTNNVIIHITLGRVLQAMISFKGVVIEWVVVKGYDEPCHTPTDLVTESKYEVFRRVTDHAHAATLHFASPALPEIAARSFISWLNTYSTLFTVACKQCGKHLHDYFPPTWRDFRSFDPYHFECKP